MKAKKAKVEEKKARGVDFTVLIAPVITEKAAMVGGEGHGGVIFKVAPKASKDEIKEAIQNIYNVEVASVRTINCLGKPKRSGRSSGRRSSYKKAYVRLKPGFTIELIEGV